MFFEGNEGAENGPKESPFRPSLSREAAARGVRRGAMAGATAGATIFSRERHGGKMVAPEEKNGGASTKTQWRRELPPPWRREVFQKNTEDSEKRNRRNGGAELPDGTYISLQCRDSNGGAGHYFDGRKTKSNVFSKDNVYSTRWRAAPKRQGTNYVFEKYDRLRDNDKYMRK